MSNSDSTVKFCPKCQSETERNAGGKCKMCSKARGAAWHAANRDKKNAASAAYSAANPEKMKANGAAWRSANKDKRRAYGAAYRAANSGRHKAYNAAWVKANPDKMVARRAAWYSANPEKEKARAAAYRAANPDKAKAAIAAWQKANPEACRIKEQNRRARKRNAGGRLSKGLSAKLFKLQKGKCPCCAKPLGDDYHLDHKMPLALGGSNADDNMQLLRAICNMQKKAKHPVDFMQERGFLL